jgi:hypothetical protein
MKPEVVRVLLGVFGFALYLGLPSPGLLTLSADTAISTLENRLHQGAVVAEGEEGSDEAGSEEEEQEDDSD